ncbi:type VI secretion system baseplate subunit TssG [Pseudomonas aeruginosa]|uniref:type VI secretion system baseplate subunit TssG n=1 Tax=Pseudomonas aeruginosa TaxID=287 RepID=UPI0018C505E5|nr:type VI secretion system baseplate subunit TssG [Pseudomonas aeruginosa]MBG4736726.1 type VI secretion system baseplate subunit TssG [Pseudomonas aeruginosa]MDA3152699.1 type VI secretion system baseplate subunit TssG [Pseudomonas aeruginosa]
MADTQRHAAPDLNDRLLDEARGHNFFCLLERLHGLHGDDLESEEAYAAERQRIRLSNYAGMGFPASDVSLAQRLDGDLPHQYLVQATFFGMHGPDSPLPSYYLERLAYEAGQGEGIRPAFLDFFNHRLLTLLHQGWRKYRHYIRFRPGASDLLSQRLFALVGLKDDAIRGATPIAWSRLLSFAGAVVHRSRSPAMVAGLIAHCFDLPDVAIRDFELRYTDIAPDDRAQLGRRNGQLGESFRIGDSVRTRHCKFTIVITNLSETRFREFLPQGENFERLRMLVAYLLRDQTPCDLELGLRENEVPPFNLGQVTGSHLGWTSFLEQPELRRPPRVRLTVRT